jgi:hypothetical protein
MKYVSRFCAGSVLALSLTLTAYAGHIPCGVTDDPPPSTQQATTTGETQTGVTGDMSTSVTGEMTTGVTGDISTSVMGEMSTGITAIDPATNIFLNLLQSLLSLF